jgi:hypothetical protein
MQAVVPSAVAAAVAAAIIIRSIKSKTVFLFIKIDVINFFLNKRGRAWADCFHGGDLAML